jgi:hypothetical protein
MFIVQATGPFHIFSILELASLELLCIFRANHLLQQRAGLLELPSIFLLILHCLKSRTLYSLFLQRPLQIVALSSI